MFCRFKGEDKQLEAETVYYLQFQASGFQGQLLVQMPGMFTRRYNSFEEFINEWEIV